MDTDKIAIAVNDTFYHFREDEDGVRLLSVLTLQEAARYAGVRADTVRNWIFRDKVSYRRSDRVYLIDVRSLDNHLATKKGRK